MAFNQEQLEYLHKLGRVPDWVYYTYSDMPVAQKLEEQTDKFLNSIFERRQIEQAKRQKELEEKEAQKQIDKMVADGLEKALSKGIGDILKGLK